MKTHFMNQFRKSITEIIDRVIFFNIDHNSYIAHYTTIGILVTQNDMPNV